MNSSYERIRGIRARRLAAGLCIYCGKNPVSPPVRQRRDGRPPKQCQPCRDKAREALRAWRLDGMTGYRDHDVSCACTWCELGRDKPRTRCRCGLLLDADHAGCDLRAVRFTVYRSEAAYDPA